MICILMGFKSGLLVSESHFSSQSTFIENKQKQNGMERWIWGVITPLLYTMSL